MEISFISRAFLIIIVKSAPLRTSLAFMDFGVKPHWLAKTRAMVDLPVPGGP